MLLVRSLLRAALLGSTVCVPEAIMELTQRPELRQKVTLSPQVYQGLTILAMPVVELQSLIETELLENPVLELEIGRAHV